MRRAKQAGASVTNAIREETKRKSLLFDMYLDGSLTRDDCLLSGFTPQPRKVVRKIQIMKQLVNFVDDYLIFENSKGRRRTVAQIHIGS